MPHLLCETFVGVDKCVSMKTDNDAVTQELLHRSFDINFWHLFSSLCFISPLFFRSLFVSFFPPIAITENSRKICCTTAPTRIAK